MRNMGSMRNTRETILLKLQQMGTPRVHMKGVIPWLVPGSLGSSCPYKRFFSCLGCSGRPSTKYFFSSLYSISLRLSQSPSKAGQAMVPGLPVS
jgi:hypothetical protein